MLSKDYDYHIFAGLQKQKFKGCALVSDKFQEIKIMDVDETIVEINSLLKMIKNDTQDRIVPHKIEPSICIKIQQKYYQGFLQAAQGNTKKAASMIFNDLKMKLGEKIKK